MNKILVYFACRWYCGHIKAMSLAELKAEIPKLEELLGGQVIKFSVDQQLMIIDVWINKVLLLVTGVDDVLDLLRKLKHSHVQSTLIDAYANKRERSEYHLCLLLDQVLSNSTGVAQELFGKWS